MVTSADTEPFVICTKWVPNASHDQILYYPRNQQEALADFVWTPAKDASPILPAPCVGQHQNNVGPLLAQYPAFQMQPNAYVTFPTGVMLPGTKSVPLSLFQ